MNSPWFWVLRSVERHLNTCQRDERGTIPFWFLGLFALFMVMGTLAVDVGMALADRRDQAKDADVMALAGALDLPENPTAAVDNARAWGARNGVDVTTGIRTSSVDNLCWSENPADDPTVMDSITIEVSRPSGSLFLRELGL